MDSPSVNGVTSMARPRSKIADFSVYVLVRLIVCVVQALSFRAALGLANALAWLAYRVDRRHRLVAIDNLLQAFPEQHTAAQREAMVRDVYRHFCGVLIEIVHLPRRLHRTNWKHYIG